MAIPSIISVGTGAAGVGDIAPAPGTHATGDLLLLIVETQNDAVAAPSGYTVVPGAPIASAALLSRISAFYKFAASGAEGAPTVVDPGNHAYGRIIAIRGVDPINPFHRSAGCCSPATVSGTFPSVYTRVANCLILNMMAWALDSAGPVSSAEANALLSSVTEQADEGTADGNGGGLVVISGGLADAGESGITTATFIAGVAYTGLTLAIAPGPDTAATVAGTVTLDDVAVANGGTVEVWDTVNDRLVGTTTIAGGAGAFTVDVPYAQTCLATYDDGAGNRGRSASATPESGTFSIAIKTATATDVTDAYDEGYADGLEDGGGGAGPVMTNLEPDEDEVPGSPGAFSAIFQVARLTPIEFDLQIPEEFKVTVSVAYADRNEVLTAFDIGEVARWPFDIAPDSAVEVVDATNRHVRLLPRGGWPATTVSIVAGAGQKAV